MKKNLVKFAGGVAMAISGFGLAVFPVLADTVDLCPGAPYNTLCNTTPGLGALVGTVLSAILFIAFIAALVFLIWGGIKWIMSGGDKEGTGKAKETVTSALIGLAIVLGAWILINVVLNFFGFTGGINALPVPKIK